MKTTFLVHVIATFFLASLANAEKPSVERSATHLSVELTDGSLIKGQTRQSSLPFHTTYAQLKIRLASIRECRIDAETKQVSLLMTNGDSLTGAIDQDSLNLRSLAGKLRIQWAAIASFSVTPSSPTNQTKLYYSFDEDGDGIVRDDSGNAHHGTAHKLTYVDTPFGKGIRTNSRETYVSCDNLSLNGARQLTVSTWIKLNRYSTYGRMLNRGGESESGGGGFGMTIGGTYGSRPIDAMFGVTLEGGKAVYVKLPKFVRPGEWTHLAGTYNGREVAYYANGELIGKEKVPAEFRNLPLQEAEEVDLFAGKCSTRRTWYDTHLDGLIDELRIETRAWSPTEIRAHYTSLKPSSTATAKLPRVGRQ